MARFSLRRPRARIPLRRYVPAVASFSAPIFISGARAVDQTMGIPRLVDVELTGSRFEDVALGISRLVDVDMEPS